MPKLKYAVKKLIACWGLLMVLGLPAFAETPIAERERMEVANALVSAAVIPAAANNPGLFGAHYKTRVVIFNPTEGAVSITATLFDHNGPIGQNEIPVEANRFQVWDNFLGEVFDHSGAGAVSLMAGPGDLFYMTAEVYTDSPNGRFSTTVVNGIVPVFQPGNEPDFNVGINVNESRRTNIGVWNMNMEDMPSSIEAQVFDASGTMIQTIGFELKARAWQQKGITAPVDNGLVVWVIKGESQQHYFYAVEVDNQSNDGTLNWSVKGAAASEGGGGEASACAEGSVIQPGEECSLIAGGEAVGTFSVDEESQGCIRAFGLTLCSATMHSIVNTPFGGFVVTFVASKQEDGSWKITMLSALPASG